MSATDSEGMEQVLREMRYAVTIAEDGDVTVVATSPVQ
jgi:hypothetical protein